MSLSFLKNLENLTVVVPFLVPMVWTNGQLMSLESDVALPLGTQYPPPLSGGERRISSYLFSLLLLQPVSPVHRNERKWGSVPTLPTDLCRWVHPYPTEVRGTGWRGVGSSGIGQLEWSICRTSPGAVGVPGVESRTLVESWRRARREGLNGRCSVGLSCSIPR